MGDQERRQTRVEPQKVTFADKRAWRTVELSAQVSFLSAILPPLPVPKEGYELTPVSFSEEEFEDGYTVLFQLGDSMRSQQHGQNEDDEFTVHFIEPRTKQILDELKISYTDHSQINSSSE